MEPDGVRWRLTGNKRFSTVSMYKFLENNLAGPNYRWIWRAKLPLQIKIFLWQFFYDAILTRDNLKKRKWTGSPICIFCNEYEDANHLFFSCAAAKVTWGIIGAFVGANSCPSNRCQYLEWLYAYMPGDKKFSALLMSAIFGAIWNTRNKITFDGFVLRSPVSVIFNSRFVLS